MLQSFHEEGESEKIRVVFLARIWNFCDTRSDQKCGQKVEEIAL
jgi:hypothetical protein